MGVLGSTFAPLAANVFKHSGVTARDFDIWGVPPAAERGDAKGAATYGARKVVHTLAISDITIYDAAHRVGKVANVGGYLVGA